MVPELTPERRFLRGPVYVCLVLGFLAMQLGVMPSGIIGAACLLLPLALVLEPLGERTPILKDYLGGSPLLLIFVGAALVYFKILTPSVVGSFGSFMKETGTNFLDFFICSLITGAIFGIHSKMLVKAGLRYAAPVVGGVVASCALLALVGVVIGRGWAELVLNIGFPILGGGMGGTKHIGLHEYVVEGKTAGITPLASADQLEALATDALKGAAGINDGGNAELRETLGDIRTQARLGQYYAAKIRGAVSVGLFRQTGEAKHQTAAVAHLEQALTAWHDYARELDANYTNMLYISGQRTFDRFDDSGPKADIAIARKGTL